MHGVRLPVELLSWIKAAIMTMFDKYFSQFHWLIFSCLLMIGFSSCSKINIREENNDYISFGSPVILVETETRSVTQDALAEGDAFGVLGYCVPHQLGDMSIPDYTGGESVWGTKYRITPPSVFYKDKITVTDAGYCSYDNLRQWYGENRDLDGRPNPDIPATANQFRYTFFAYYPFDVQGGGFSVDSPTGSSDAGAPKFTFTMPQENNDIDHSRTPDAMFGVLFNRQKSQGSLTFTFSHLLTALGFEINNFSDRQLVVHSVKLSGNFFKEIVLDFSATGSLSGDDATMFPDVYYAGDYVLFDEANGSTLTLEPPAESEEKTSSGLLPKNTNGEGEYIMLISGKSPYFGQNVKVSIDYTFGGVYGSYSTGRPETFVPQPGVKYTAQLNFVGNAFVLQFVVDNNESWENGGSDDPNPDDESDYNDDVVFE